MNIITRQPERHYVDGKVITEVTTPIQAHDLNTPRVISISPRKWLVVNYKSEQIKELEELGGRYEFSKGVTFRASKANRTRLEIWQNKQARKERARILGDGWKYQSWYLNETERARVGDEIVCIDGSCGICTKAKPNICVIEFEEYKTGQTFTVGGFFFRTPFDWSKARK